MLVALISSIFTFASAAGEARAEQLPQAPQQFSEVTGGEADELVAERQAAKVSPNEPVTVETTLAVVAPLETAPAEKPPVETPAVETAPARALLADNSAGESPTPQAPELSSVPSSGSTVHPGPVTQLELIGGQPGRYGPETTLAPTPASEHATEPSEAARPVAELILPDSGALLQTGQVPEPQANLAPDPGSETGLVPPALASTLEPLEPGLVLEPVAFEGGPLSQTAGEPPAPVKEELYLLSSLYDSADGAVETIEGVAAGTTLETIAGWSLRSAVVDEGLFDVALVSRFSEIEVAHAPESELAKDPGVSLAGPTGPVESSPLRDTPQPVSPFAPPAGGSTFSLSGSSVLGSGGLVLLLFCILATGPIVLRRSSKLTLALRKLTKPNSALKLPRERPG